MPGAGREAGKAPERKSGTTGQRGGRNMKAVQRTKGIRKILRAAVRKPAQKYVKAGDRTCGRMMWEARERKQNPGPSDSAIMAWARFDLAREILGGFWEGSAA